MGHIQYYKDFHLQKWRILKYLKAQIYDGPESIYHAWSPRSPLQRDSVSTEPLPHESPRNEIDWHV